MNEQQYSALSIREIINKINQLPCFDTVTKVVAVEQGLSGTCFKVSTISNTFFVKYHELAATIANINREAIFTQLAANAAIAPNVIYSDLWFIVSEYIDVPSLNHYLMSEDKCIDHALTLMAKCHQIPINAPHVKEYNLPILNIAQVIDELVNALDLSPQQIALINKVKMKLLQLLNVKGEVLCHGDINFTNILVVVGHQTSAKPKRFLVDFECACLADNAFDIAMFIAINNIKLDLNGVKLDKIIDKYKLETLDSHQISTRKVTRYLVFCYIINALWFLDKYQQQSDEKLYAKANQQLIALDQLRFIEDTLAGQMR